MRSSILHKARVTMSHRVLRSAFLSAATISLWALLLSARGAVAADCNSNGIDDLQDISSGTSRDCNANAVPDECDLSDDGVVFDAWDPLPTGFSSSVLAQDFDGDGDPDVMVAEFGVAGPGQEPK